MPVYVEIAGRAYPLRFTLRGALRLLDLTGKAPGELLVPGLRNTALLLYAALCDGCPHVTLSQAAALCAAAAKERDALSRLLSALALAESGLDQTRLDRDTLRRLLRAARRAGYPQPLALLDATYCELCEALEDFLSRRGAKSAAPMTDRQMQGVMRALAERSKHDHP